MSKNTIVKRDTYAVTLQPNHIKYAQHCLVARGLSPEAERVATVLIEGAPRGGTDVELNREYFRSTLAVKAALDAALRDDPELVGLVEGARECTDKQAEHFDEARRILRLKKGLASTVRRLGSKELTVNDILATHKDNQDAAARAEKAGDLEHRKPTKPGLGVRILGVVASLFEVAGLWWLVFNPTDVMSYLLFVAGAAVFIGVNHYGIPVAGGLIRSHRSVTDARRHAHNLAASRATVTEIDLKGI